MVKKKMLVVLKIILLRLDKIKKLKQNKLPKTIR